MALGGCCILINSKSRFESLLVQCSQSHFCLISLPCNFFFPFVLNFYQRSQGYLCKICTWCSVSAAVKMILCLQPCLFISSHLLVQLPVAHVTSALLTYCVFLWWMLASVVKYVFFKYIAFFKSPIFCSLQWQCLYSMVVSCCVIFAK